MAGISESMAYTVDLACDTVRAVIRQPLVRGDVKAHTLTVTVLNGGTAASLTGCTASLAVVRSDGATVNCTASITGNVITAEVQAAAYNYAGETNYFVRLISGTYTRTLLWLTGTVVTSNTDTYVQDATTTLPSIDQFNTLLAQCQAAADAVAEYPYTTVQGYANTATQKASAAASSASAAAASAEEARTSSGIPGGGSEGYVLMKTATASAWTDIMTGINASIDAAGHTITAGTATYNDTATVTSKYCSAERSFTFDIGGDTPDAVIVTGISFDKTYSSSLVGLVIHSIHTSVSGSTVTVYYMVTNAGASNFAPGNLTAYYIAFS